jgi:hypothetical protein
MVDRWKTKPILMEGGLILNEDAISQGINKPGSLIKAINVESSLNGGYRRINGYAKYDPSPVPGSGPVFGAFVFNDSVVACRGANIYWSSGLGTWTRINTFNDHAGASKYRKCSYNWTTESLILVDGVHLPCRYTPDEVTKYIVITDGPEDAELVVSFKYHLFFASGSKITFSAPNQETNYAGVDGAGQFVTSGKVTGLAVWRDELFIFHENSIEKLSGSGLDTFVLSPVTSNIGCISMDSVQEVNGDIIYYSADGIRTIAGTAKIGDVELASISRQVQSKVNNLKIISTAAGFISSVVIRDKSQYRIFPTNSFILEPLVRGLIGCIRQTLQGNLSWEWFETVGINPVCIDSGYASGNELVVHGGWNGYVYRHDFSNGFDGGSIVSSLQTAYCPYDDPEIRKTVYKLTSYAEFDGNTSMNVATSFDFEDDSSVAGEPIGFGTNGAGVTLFDFSGSVFDSDESTFDANQSPRLTGDLLGSGFTISFTFYSENTDPSYVIKSVMVQYTINGRR